MWQCKVVAMGETHSENKEPKKGAFIYLHTSIRSSVVKRALWSLHPSVQLNWKDRKHPPSVIPPLIALHYEECKKHVLRNEVRCYEIRLLLHFLVESVCPRVIFPLLHPQHHIINYKLTCSHANRRACTAWRKQKKTKKNTHQWHRWCLQCVLS